GIARCPLWPLCDQRAVWWTPSSCLLCLSFFFNDTATTEIYPLSLHDALPISSPRVRADTASPSSSDPPVKPCTRSEEHTSELQSLTNLVCRLLLEKNK